MPCGECKWWAVSTDLGSSRIGDCSAPTPVCMESGRRWAMIDSDGDGCPLFTPRAQEAN